MNEKEICRAFSILNRQLKFDNLTEEDIHRTKNRAQFFLDKLSSLMQLGHALDFKSIFWSNKFLGSISTAMNKRDMYNSGEFSLDIRGYHAQSCFMIEAKVDSMSANHLVQAFDMFDDEDLQERLVLSALESLRQQKIDIRLLNLSQIARLVTLVGKYSSKDLKVFYNYVETAFSA